MTDEAGQYAHLNKDFTSHEYVNHGAGEYGRGDVHTNTFEGHFLIFKRGMKGISIAQRSICIVTSRNLTSGTQIASSSA